MKKHLIAFLLLIVAAGGSVGAFLVVKDKKKTEDKKAMEEEADLQLFSFDPESIKEIKITSSEESYTATVDEKGVWSITEGGDFPADQDYFKLICNYASSLAAESSHSGEPQVFGLDDENVKTIVLSDGSESYTLNIGAVSPTRDYYYVSVGSRSGIYAVPSIYGSAFDTSRLMLKSKAIVPYGSSDIAELIFKKDGKVTCDIVYDPETTFWKFKEESALDFDTTAASSMVSVITRLSAEQMLEEGLEDLSKYGFDKPYGEAIIKGLDGTEHHITFGNETPDGVYQYVLVGDDDQVQVYYKSDINFIDKTTIDFVMTTLYNPNPDLVSGFKLTYGGSEYDFKLDMLEKKCTYGDKEYDLNIEKVYTAFNNFYNSFSTKILTDVDQSASPELKDPVLTVVYYLKEGGEFTYQLVDNGNGNCYVFNDGKYEGGLVSSESLSGKNSVKSFLEKFISVLD